MDRQKIEKKHKGEVIDPGKKKKCPGFTGKIERQGANDRQYQ
jgi:hypothetical protein